jgi:hypothetical protein
MGLSWKLSSIICLFFYVVQILFLFFVNIFGFSSIILTLTPAILFVLYYNFSLSKSILIPLLFFSFFDDLRLGIYLGTNLIIFIFIFIFIKSYLEKNFIWSQTLIFLFSIVSYYIILYVFVSNMINIFNFSNLFLIVLVNSCLNWIFFFVIQKSYKYLLVGQNEN